MGDNYILNKNSLFTCLRFNLHNSGRNTILGMCARTYLYLDMNACVYVYGMNVCLFVTLIYVLYQSINLSVN